MSRSGPENPMYIPRIPARFVEEYQPAIQSWNSILENDNYKNWNFVESQLTEHPDIFYLLMVFAIYNNFNEMVENLIRVNPDNESDDGFNKEYFIPFALNSGNREIIKKLIDQTNINISFDDTFLYASEMLDRIGLDAFFKKHDGDFCYQLKTPTILEFLIQQRQYDIAIELLEMFKDHIRLTPQLLSSMSGDEKIEFFRKLPPEILNSTNCVYCVFEDPKTGRKYEMASSILYELMRTSQDDFVIRFLNEFPDLKIDGLSMIKASESTNEAVKWCVINSNSINNFIDNRSPTLLDYLMANKKYPLAYEVLDRFEKTIKLNPKLYKKLDLEVKLNEQNAMGANKKLFSQKSIAKDILRKMQGISRLQDTEELENLIIEKPKNK